MDNITDVKGENFGKLMIWVALIGAALILAIDYSLKRDLLKLSERAHVYYHASMGDPLAQSRVREYEYRRTQDSGSGVPDLAGTSLPDSVGNGTADVEMGTLDEYRPFPTGIRSEDSPKRDAKGRFAQSDDSAGNNDSGIPDSDKPVGS